MKRLTILCGIALALGGCADPLEQRTPQEVQNQLQRGVTGEGRLIESESTNNPTGVPAAAQTPPGSPGR
jgi:hypothetical protein